MNINLEYYKIFYYVAKLGGITAAAEFLCISQPAVSQSIKQLEKQLGGALFVRMHKGVRLTPEGEELFGHVRRGYEDILRGEEQFHRLTELEKGEVRVGASDMVLKSCLLPYLERFQARYPGVKVRVTGGSSPETCQALAEGKLDFGVISTPIWEEPGMRADLELKMLREIEDVFVAGSRYVSMKRRTVSYEELELLPVISAEKNTSTRRFIDKYLAEMGVTLRPDFELSSSDMIVQFARRNLGVGCVIRDFAQEYLDSGELFEILFERKMPKRQIAVVTARQNPMSGAARALLQLMEK